jgi:hypothetical protein
MCKKVIPDAPDDHPPRPFCSANCKLADLHNWLGEKYRIPSEHESSEPDGSDPSAAN